MQVFDNLIGNFDRNQGNILIDEGWKLWLIDHTRSFRPSKSLPTPDAISRCSRGLWEALQALEVEQLEASLDPYLAVAEIRTVIARRDRIVELLGKRIERMGEKRVIFDWSDPNPDVRVFEDPVM